MKCWAKIKSFFKQPKAKAKVEEPEVKATEGKAAEGPETKAGKASEKKA